MNDQIHTVLGGNGAIGQAVINELRARNLSIQAVERSKDVAQIKTIRADLLDESQAVAAIAGSAYVYLCVGLPYQSDVWLNQWPLIMKNVITACEKTNARLIFFDNMYMYGPSPLPIPFDENTSQRPTTKKGRARKETADLFLEAIHNKQLKGFIGRSADFYGPGAVNSLLYVSFLERMLQGKSPQLIARPGINHTYAYTLDIGKALVTLALDESAYGQVWHLPVGRPIAIEEIVDLFNKELLTDFKASFISKFMLKALSIVIPLLKEAGEMSYQFDNEYVMSFEKFKKAYPDFTVTPYEKGLPEMVAWFKEHGGR